MWENMKLINRFVAAALPSLVVAGCSHQVKDPAMRCQQDASLAIVQLSMPPGEPAQNGALPFGRLRRPAGFAGGRTRENSCSHTFYQAKKSRPEGRLFICLAERGGASQPDPKSLILLAERKPGCVLFCVPEL